MTYRIPSLLAAAALLAGACSDDDPGNGSPDASAPAIDAAAPDALDPCTNPTSVLVDPFRSIDAVSIGAIVATGNAATVDATAGGSPNAADNPYIYLKFAADSVTKVEITDVESYSDESWDLALKRYVLRINGGDSGPGGVEVSRVAAENLADVTEVPADAMFVTDDWFSDECTLVTGPLLSEPATALVDWYDYDEDTNLPTPKAEVYLLRRADGSVIKLDIKNYRYEGATGHYEIEWGAL